MLRALSDIDAGLLVCFYSLQVGFIDDVQFFFDQLSASNDVVKVADGSNIGIAGRYIYRVDGTEVLMPGCLPYSGVR